MTMRGGRRPAVPHAALVAASALLAASSASAQGAGAKDCSEWVAKKGYSVDYIVRVWRPSLPVSGPPPE